MNLRGFTFIVTEDCNFNCSYCYQEKDKTYMDFSMVKKAVDFFSPFFNGECHVCPVDAGLSGAVMGNIQDHLCRVNRAIRKVRNQFLKEIGRKSGYPVEDVSK